MKRALMILSALSLAFAIGMNAEAKTSKKNLRAYENQCKAENPNIKKKALRKCVKAKARSSHSA
ncbi:hypothetical protein [Bdellovibrio sp. HCB2-146]|uniref:hypothetical protein n=1 Tax=Bdellovibrio sp. HCB2-146 TaxID=3394362 RepID=UPI0039BD62BB